MRTTTQFRQRVAKGIAIGTLLIVLSILFAPIASAGTPSQWGVSWDYRLLGKLNSAQDPGTGLMIVITGSGSLDLSQSTIDGGGGYTVFNKAGNVVGGGTWMARTLDSFEPMGPGHSPGEGGKLELEAWFDGSGANALTGRQHVVIMCSMWGPKVGPPGYPWPPDYVEVGPYTEHQTGAVMFNLNQ